LNTGTGGGTVEVEKRQKGVVRAQGVGRKISKGRLTEKIRPKNSAIKPRLYFISTMYESPGGPCPLCRRPW